MGEISKKEGNLLLGAFACMYNAEEKLSLLDSFFLDLKTHNALRASLSKSSIIHLSNTEMLSTRRTQISAGEHWAGG
jgi:hypothetical protein